MPSALPAPAAEPRAHLCLTLPSGEVLHWDIPADAILRIERPGLPPKHRDRHLRLLP
jgi:hypothetical protein